MSSINNQQYAPQYRYEMPPTSQSPSSSDPAGASANPANTTTESKPPRPPVGAEQRGQFSRHNNIVNQQPQGAESKGELAELTQKNQNLVAKYEALITKYNAKIIELNTKIEGLTQQLTAGAKTPEHAPSAPDTKPENPRADSQPVPPETPATPDTQTRGTETAERSPPQGLDKLEAEITQLHTALKTLLERFEAAMKTLTTKLDNLTQLLSKGVPRQETPAVQPGTTDSTPPNNAAPDTAAPEQRKESAPADNSTAPAPGKVDRLKQANEELEAQINQMEAYFEKTLSTFEQKFQALTQQVSEKKN
ncbi:hypothetical protein [Pseudomonas sp. TE24901]